MAEITAKTAPQPPLPGEAPEAEVLHIETLLTEYRNHVVVGLLLVLVATVVYFWYTNNLEVRTAKAWDEFGLLLDKEDKEERLKGFERLLELEASGTQVKPWLLWQLAHTYVSLQNYDKAKTTLKQLKKDHPRHYLNTRREIASDPESTFVKKALVALEKEIEFWQNWKAPPKENLPKAKILTSKGTIEVELFQDHCPEVVKMFVHLAETGFYDNLKFRDAFDKKIYTGTLMADGKGHPAYTLKKVYSDESHLEAGSLVMRSNEKEEFTGEIYFTTEKFPLSAAELADQQHTVFGRIVEASVTEEGSATPHNPNLKTLQALKAGDLLFDIHISGKRKDVVYLPQAALEK